MNKHERQISKLLKSYHKTFDCFGNRNKVKKEAYEWYVTSVNKNNFEYIISKKNNNFFINKRIPNNNNYPKYFNDMYAGNFIEIQFEKANSLKKAKQLIKNDKDI